MIKLVIPEYIIYNIPLTTSTTITQSITKSTSSTTIGNQSNPVATTRMYIFTTPSTSIATISTLSLNQNINNLIDLLFNKNNLLDITESTSASYSTLENVELTTKNIGINSLLSDSVTNEG